MDQDASLPQHAPTTTNPATVVNTTSVYTHTLANGHGEVDASVVPPVHSSLREVCADINSRLESFLSAPPENEVVKRTQGQTRVAISVMLDALQRYEFDAVSLSYNGGKDCLVLLVLYLSALHIHFSQAHSRRVQSNHESSPSSTPPFPSSIPSIYAKPPDPFPEVTKFVDSSSAEYHLDLTHITTNPGPDPKTKSHSSPPKTSSLSTSQTNEKPIITFRDAFALYLASHPKIKAIFVGTRRTDPHGQHLTHFQPTDGNWPAFMRIHPIIDWHLDEIWTFLRSPHLGGGGGHDPSSDSKSNSSSSIKRLDYCKMYDQGYTSLGGVDDTLRNPRLKVIDEKTGKETYRPAYEMTEDDEERLGRE